MVNGGDPPHTTAFEAMANLALRLNLAVLKINWEFQVVPSELAQLVYNSSAIIDPGRLCLWGEGIGGLVTFNWAAEQRGNGAVSHLVLQNPVADLVSLAKYSDVPDVAWQVGGCRQVGGTALGLPGPPFRSAPVAGSAF